MRTIALAKREDYGTRKSFRTFIPQRSNCAKQHHTSWCSGILTEKGWSSDFPPLPSAFSPKRVMAFMLRSHNGVHCCGTVGDSHSHSQLSTAKCTFTGDSFQNHDAKIQLFFELTSFLIKKLAKNRRNIPMIAADDGRAGSLLPPN